jgi:hypothetical protein
MARVTLALDQSFPIPVMNTLGKFLPEVELVPLRRIDNRLIGLGDRDLLIALRQLGWPGLVTANAKLLRNPATVTALLATDLAVIVIDGVADDPLRAVGALLLALPGALSVCDPGQPRVAQVRSGLTLRTSPAELLERVAARQRRDIGELLTEFGISGAELSAPVLPAR